MRPPELEKKLPELVELERVLELLSGIAQVTTEAVVPYKNFEFPLYSICIGSSDKSHPTIAYFGGVHGLERIGTDVVVAYLRTLAELLRWDKDLQRRLQTTRLVFMPLVNPVGMYLTRRANGNNIDLMRNSTIVAQGEAPFLLSGQRLSPHLPWYRGFATQESEMELEARTVINFVKREVFPARCSLALDVHSGFGMMDQLWFPWAYTKTPPPHINEITALKNLLDKSYPYHFYKIEPQALNYTTHGDLWDYLYQEHMKTNSDSVFIPWALEMGSWMWLKKNPLQVFSSLGPFNPMLPHRARRIRRRHITLFEFLFRAIGNPGAWLTLDNQAKLNASEQAKALWYAAG